MKGYGLSRRAFLDYPDPCDIREFGLKTSTGRVDDGRDDHGHSRPKTRRSARLNQRKVARREAKKVIHDVNNW